MASFQISFRPITEADKQILSTLYAETRWEELLPVPWSETDKKAFLQMQFDAQHAYYLLHFADAQFDLILVNGIPAGRLYLHERQDEIRIIDIALLKKYQDKGIGTQLLNQILNQGKINSKPVRIHVEKNNPALRLYRRLGFQEIADQGIYLFMEWVP